MFQLSFRLGAMLIALAMCLTGCGSSAAGPSNSSDISSSIGSSSDSETGSGLEEAIPVVMPEPEPEPQPVLTQEDVDQALAEVMEHYGAAGVTVATVEMGQLSQAGAWGWAVKNEREMTPDTKIRIASISKVVIAMCAMAMAEEGIIDLDAPISN